MNVLLIWPFLCLYLPNILYAHVTCLIALVYSSCLVLAAGTYHDFSFPTCMACAASIQDYWSFNKSGVPDHW